MSDVHCIHICDHNYLHKIQGPSFRVLAFPGTAGELEITITSFFAGIVVRFPFATHILAVDTIGSTELWFLEGKHDRTLPRLNPWVVVTFHHVLLAFFD